MPFTASHPALVLPFARIQKPYISASCLVIGSITPDFEYFLTLKLTGRYSHTFEGIFLFCLPVAIALTIVFHYVVRRNLIVNLPMYARKRLITLHDFNFFGEGRKYVFGYLLCILAGIISHLFWDRLTNVSDFFILRSDQLFGSFKIAGLIVLPTFNVLQHASTLIGAAYIIWFFHKLPTKTTGNLKPVWWYWPGVMLTCAIVFYLRWKAEFEYFGDVVATVIAGLLAGIIFMSFIAAWHNTRIQI